MVHVMPVRFSANYIRSHMCERVRLAVGGVVRQQSALVLMAPAAPCTATRTHHFLIS